MSQLRTGLKRALGRMPLTAEIAEALRPVPGELAGGYRLDRLAESLPAWIEAAFEARRRPWFQRPRRVLLMGYLRWWMEYATALALLLSGSGNEVDLAILPYRTWTEEVEPFNLRRQAASLRRLLRPAKRLLGLQDLSRGNVRSLPNDLFQEIETQSRVDVQYTRQREELDLSEGGVDHALFHLRLQRNLLAAASAYALLRRRRHDVLVVPNGSILEFGAVYRVARTLGVPVVTYEFGEQRGRMWLAQNAEVMQQDTTALWAARGGAALSESERGSIRSLYAARRGGMLWSNFARRWQAAESQGAQEARRQLQLEQDKPLVLLCTNVVGDSLALGRQVFTEGMAEWLAQTVRHLAARSDLQLVVRVHPGELRGAGYPSAEIVEQAVPELPAHVKVVPPGSQINTYDLIELAQVGLVYTSTAGLEMAMAGVPVIVAGKTHYRGKGFTHDPATMADYLETLDRLLGLGSSNRLSLEQVELAWRYAYRFFFEYPFPVPWHLIGFWEDMRTLPMQAALRDENLTQYGRTLRALTGEPVDWGEARRPQSGS